jgi:glycosyltransferase involved in cell wall biosynthesis
MRSSHKYDVCASVISDLEFDARVWKEARSLAQSGRSVALIGTAFDIDRFRQWRDPSGVDVQELPLGWRNRSKSVSRRLYALLRVWFRVLRTDARAYHAHDIHVVIPAWLASRIRGARFVYDAHELWTETYNKGLAAKVVQQGSRFLERLAVRGGDAVITTNNARATALTHSYGRSDITVLANVPFLEEKAEARDPGYPEGKRILLYVGRISAEGRPFREAIQALRHLDESVHFAIIGFGWESERDRIREWAREYGVGDRVHLLPAMPFAELAGAAAAATVGLVPLYGIPVNDRLGDTNKLHEYLMGGIPVVASDLPEIRRVVTLGDPAVGELFDAASPESIAAAITAVIDDPRYLERRREARRNAEERFNWSVEERKLVSLYGELLGEQELAAPGAAVLERT